jgi:hypothetical protein
MVTRPVRSHYRSSHLRKGRRVRDSNVRKHSRYQKRRYAKSSKPWVSADYGSDFPGAKGLKILKKDELVKTAVVEHPDGSFQVRDEEGNLLYRGGKEDTEHAFKGITAGIFNRVKINKALKEEEDARWSERLAARTEARIQTIEKEGEVKQNTVGIQIAGWDRARQRKQERTGKPKNSIEQMEGESDEGEAKEFSLSDGSQVPTLTKTVTTPKGKMEYGKANTGYWDSFINVEKEDKLF